jgi:hypothetical protein
MCLPSTKHPTGGKQCASCLKGKNSSGFKHMCQGILWAWPTAKVQSAEGQQRKIVSGFSQKMLIYKFHILVDRFGVRSTRLHGVSFFRVNFSVVNFPAIKNQCHDIHWWLSYTRSLGYRLPRCF